MLDAGCWIVGCANFIGCQGAGNKIAVDRYKCVGVAVCTGKVAVQVPLVRRCCSAIYRVGGEGDLLACTDRGRGGSKCNTDRQV